MFYPTGYHFHINDQPHVERSIAEEYVTYIIANSVLNTMTLDEIENASLADPILQRSVNVFPTRFKGKKTIPNLSTCQRCQLNSGIHIDLCSPFPTDESLLVLIDAWSRWTAVEILSTTTTTIPLSIV